MIRTDNTDSNMPMNKLRTVFDIIDISSGEKF